VATTATLEPAPQLSAVSFALWATAVLDGRTSLDEAAAVISGGRMHRLTGVPGETGPTTLAVALGRLRAAGAEAFGVLLPAPGDPLGLGGPRSFNEAAVAAGQAVVAPHLHLALIPESAGDDQGRFVHWQVWSDLPPGPAPESTASAGRALREAVLDAAVALAELDAPSTPGAEPAVPHPHLVTPPGLDPRAHDLLERAERLLTAVRAALADPAVTTSATLDTRRRRALVPVERAARRALVAACHPVLAELRHP
jgi:hypothetical protein